MWTIQIASRGGPMKHKGRRPTKLARTDEWVIVADNDRGATIVRSGYGTAAEAGAVRRELEARLPDDDSTNFLLLPRHTAEAIIAEEKAATK